MDCPPAEHDDARHRGWHALLDALESEARAGRGLAARSTSTSPTDADDSTGTGQPADPAADPWTPSPHLGSLPDCLADRAAEVLASQAQAIDELGGALAATRRHESALAAVPTVSSRAPIYLDVLG